MVACGVNSLRGRTLLGIVQNLYRYGGKYGCSGQLHFWLKRSVMAGGVYSTSNPFRQLIQPHKVSRLMGGSLSWENSALTKHFRSGSPLTCKRSEFWQGRDP